jgi:hypothetical protein
MISSHGKHMLLGGTAILILLLALRVPLGTAISYAVLLACPLMMAVMMWTMRRSDDHAHDNRTEVPDDERRQAPQPDR